MGEQQIMLITGTRKGIGRHLAEYYVKKGYIVYGCSRTPVDYESKNYRHFYLDVSDETNALHLFSEIRKTHNRLDILINNAGIASMNYTLLASVQTAQSILNTNVVGTFLFCREASKLMHNNSYGRIVNISTIHVPLCTKGSSLYSASKAAIEQLSKILAREVASSGITVNTLGLSFVNHTGMVENLSEDAISKTLDQTILKSKLDFSDVTHAINFFISEKSNMVTGQTLYLGGV